MLFAGTVRSGRLPAVTHADGTARVQCVDPDGPVLLRSILLETKRLTGDGANTSLNWPGRGTIEDLDDALRFAAERGVDHVLAAGRWWHRQPPEAAAGGAVS